MFARSAQVGKHLPVHEGDVITAVGKVGGDHPAHQLVVEVGGELGEPGIVSVTAGADHEFVAFQPVVDHLHHQLLLL